MTRSRVTRVLVVLAALPAALVSASFALAIPQVVPSIRGSLTTTPNDACTYCFTANGGTACHTKEGGCASNQVCSGEGGVNPDGTPWARALCKPATDAPPIDP